MPRPIDIPDDAVFDGARKIVLGPPEGMSEGQVGSVDAMLVPKNELGVPEWFVVWELDDEDLDSLIKHRKIFVTFMTPYMIPHRLTYPAKDQEDAYWSLFSSLSSFTGESDGSGNVVPLKPETEGDSTQPENYEGQITGSGEDAIGNSGSDQQGNDDEGDARDQI